jgi:O-antigen ligase
MYITFTTESLPIKLLIVLFWILPWGLGKHFELTQAFVAGQAVPYLIPTLYLQDLLVLGIVVACVLSTDRKVLAPTAYIRLVGLFLLAALLSLVFAGRLYPSGYFLARQILYFAFFVLGARLFRTPALRRWLWVALVGNLLLLSLLGLAQFHKQGAVFNNYLLFGEQPYSIYTPAIPKESYGGVAKLPPHGTFLHPNIFAGYLVLTLTLASSCFFGGTPRRKLGLAFVTAGCLVVVWLTKSYTAWAACALGFVLTLYTRCVRTYRLVSIALLAVCSLVVLLGLTLPAYKAWALAALPADATTSALSVERRANLLDAAYSMIGRRPFFGWGVNAFTYSFEPFYTRVTGARFLQPVHNVYVLMAAELGLFGAVAFIVLTLYSVYRAARTGRYTYSIALVQVSVFASFDHYFFTVPHMQLAFILTLLMSLPYTKTTNCL